MIAERGSRIAALALAAVAGVGLWQALKLERWGFDGPDAGFFPQIVAAACVLLSLVIVIWPGRPNAGDDGEADASDEGAIQTRNTFAIYVAALGVLAVGTLTLGFAPTAMLVTVLVMRFAEARSWTASVAYGAICALVGLVLFGWLLRVDLPQGPVEQFFYSMVR